MYPYRADEGRFPMNRSASLRTQITSSRATLAALEREIDALEREIDALERACSLERDVNGVVVTGP